MLKTKSGLPKFCTGIVDRHGRRRVRFRRGRFSIYIPGTPWGEEFMRAYASAVEQSSGVPVMDVNERKTIPGSFDALCVAYYRSSDFSNLEESTRKVRRGILEKFRADHGKKPIAQLTRTHIKKFFDERSRSEVSDKKKSGGPAAANNLIKTLRTVLAYAVGIGMLETNPADDVKMNKSGEGNHVWTEAEIAQFEAKYAVGTRERLAFDLLLYTSQRCGDVARMGWQNVTGDEIAVRQGKTKTPLVLMFHPALKLSLASVPRTNMTFVTNLRGAPFSSKNFGNWFKRACRSAGLPHCSAHGLRHSSATRLAEAGSSASQIAAMTGHRSLGQVQQYTRNADQRRLARQAVENQLRAEAEQSCPTSQTQVSNLGKK